MKVGPPSRSPPSPTSQHLAASEAGSPQSTQSASNGTVYASADAARVGGGLYSHLLDAAITLATDPALVVAATGAQLLRIAGVELVESDLPPGEYSRLYAFELLALYAALCDYAWLTYTLLATTPYINCRYCDPPVLHHACKVVPECLFLHTMSCGKSLTELLCAVQSR